MAILPDMGRSWRRVLPYLAAVILLAAVFHAVPGKEIWGSLKTCHPFPLAAALALQLGSRGLGAIRTKILTNAQGISLSIGRIFEIGCASALYGLALPGSFSGGIVRWYRISQPEGKRVGTLAVIAADRAVDFFVLASLGVLCWLGDPSPVRPPMVVWTLAGIAVSLSLAGLYCISDLSTPLERWLSSAGGPLGWLPESVRRVLKRFASSLREYRSIAGRRLVALLAISIAFHGLVTASHYYMATALGMDLSILSLCWIRACTVFLTILPLTPSGLGVREVSLVWLLLPFGVPASRAVAFSLLQFAGLLVIVMMGAFFDTRRYLWKRMNGPNIGPG
jgi:glycosyltransferase 2 family protein